MKQQHSNHYLPNSSDQPNRITKITSTKHTSSSSYHQINISSACTDENVLSQGISSPNQSPNHIHSHHQQPPFLLSSPYYPLQLSSPQPCTALPHCLPFCLLSLFSQSISRGAGCQLTPVALPGSNPFWRILWICFFAYSMSVAMIGFCFLWASGYQYFKFPLKLFCF